jgi:hypothetical protein
MPLPASPTAVQARAAERDSAAVDENTPAKLGTVIGDEAVVPDVRLAVVIVVQPAAGLHGRVAFQAHAAEGDAAAGN